MDNNLFIWGLEMRCERLGVKGKLLIRICLVYVGLEMSPLEYQVANLNFPDHASYRLIICYFVLMIIFVLKKLLVRELFASIVILK